MSEAAVVYLGLGSNLGDRLGYLRRAVAALKDHSEISIIAVSPVYESAAHTLEAGESHPAFLNAAIAVRTVLELLELLEVCQSIEREAGRERRAKWSPRTLDLDVLIFGSTTFRSEQITIPHPRMAEREFVLRPLADIAPDLHVPPPFDTTVRSLLESCPDRGRIVRSPLSLSDDGLRARSRP